MPASVFMAALCRGGDPGLISHVGNRQFEPEFPYGQSTASLAVGMCCGRDIPSLSWLALLWPFGPKPLATVL